MTSEQPDFGSRAEFYTFAPETLAQELPQFDIRREVGKGAMGIVYEAITRSDGSRVALKILPPSLTLTERALARFVREGQIMQRIEHPSICKVLDLGHKGRLHYFVMEFVDGTSLDERLRTGPFPIRRAAEIGAAVARALQFAHERGVVHRDVKPGNVMLRDADGAVKITDFGLARETGTGSMTESGAVIGTPMYMAPEQIRGERGTVDSRADVYGVGATLYQLVTGEPPFRGPSTQAVLSQVLDQDPAAPRTLRHELPPAFEAIILKALEKEPAHRYGSALELAEDLDRFLRDERVLARRPGLAKRSWRRVRRHPTVSGLVAVVLALTIGALLLWQSLRTRQLEADLAGAESALAQSAVQRDDQQRPLTPEARRALLERAVEQASSVIARDEGFARAWLVRAKAHHRMQAYDDALTDLDRAAKVGGLTTSVLHYRIDTLRQLDTPAAAARLRDDLFRLLEIDRSPYAWAMVVDHLVALARQTGEPADRAASLDLAERVLAHAPEPGGGPRVAIARATLFELRGDKGAAIATMRRVRDENRGDPLVMLEAARLFARLGRGGESAAAVAAARALDPSLVAVDEDVTDTPARIEAGEVRGFLRSLDRLLEAIDTGSGRDGRR